MVQDPDRLVPESHGYANAGTDELAVHETSPIPGAGAEDASLSRPSHRLNHLYGGLEIRGRYLIRGEIFRSPECEFGRIFSSFQEKNGAPFRASDSISCGQDMLDQILVVPNGHDLLAKIEDLFQKGLPHKPVFDQATQIIRNQSLVQG